MEASTQTKISFDEGLNSITKSSQTGRSKSSQSVRTVVRMNGYPSARVRYLKKAAVIRRVSPKRKVMRNSFMKPVAEPKIDNKGIFILHQPSPARKINHKLPILDHVTSKIDNKGIDIYKWRTSMLSLRDIVNPYERQFSGRSRLGEEMKMEIRTILTKKLNEVTPQERRSESKSVQTEPSPLDHQVMDENSSGVARRFSKASLQSQSRKVSDDFISQLRRKFQEKLRWISNNDDTGSELSSRSSLESEPITEIILDESDQSRESSAKSDLFIHELQSDESGDDDGASDGGEDMEVAQAVSYESASEQDESDDHRDQTESLTSSSSPQTLVPPSPLNGDDMVELEGMKENSEDRNDSSASDSTLSSVVRPSVGVDPDEISLDVQSLESFPSPPSTASSSSTSSTKTILNVPGTPKIIVEDFRHKSDNAYSITNSSDDGSGTDSDAKVEEEDEDTSIQSEASSSSLPSSSTFVSTTTTEYDEPEDDRTIFRLPQRSSSQKTEHFQFCTPFWFCCRKRPRSNGLQTIQAVAANPKTIHVREAIHD